MPPCVSYNKLKFWHVSFLHLISLRNTTEETVSAPTMNAIIFCTVIFCSLGCAYSSYLPPFIYGEPQSARVASFREEVDYRGYSTFGVISEVLNEDGELVEAMVHRYIRPCFYFKKNWNSPFPCFSPLIFLAYVMNIFLYRRHYGEFEDLDLLLKQHLKLWRTFPWTLPEEKDANIVNLSAYLAALMTNDQIRLVINFKL